MVIEIVSEKNAEEYRDFLPEIFFRSPIKLGIICLDEESWMPVGFTMLKLEEYRLLIRYIFVREEYRHQGAGSMMLTGSCEMAESAGLDRVEIYFNTLTDKDRIPYEFLFANGFIISEEGKLLSFFAHDLLSSGYVKNLKYPKQLDDYECLSLEDLTEARERGLKRLLDRQGKLPLLELCRRDISYLCVKDGKERGCILCNYDETKNLLTIMALVSVSSDAICVAKLLLTLGHYAAENIKVQTVVAFREAEKFKTKLAVMLLDDSKKLKNAGAVLHGVKVI